LRKVRRPGSVSRPPADSMKCIRCNSEIAASDPVFEIKSFRHCEKCFNEVTNIIREQQTTKPRPEYVASTASPADVLLTTAPDLAGYRVTRTLDIVTAECVLGLNFLRDFLAGMSDFFGGRSGTTQNKLREARQYCLSELRAEAQSLGANAVIAVSLSYSEFSGQGKSMLFLVASGTAVVVVVEKFEPPSVQADITAGLPA
jgi:uncharacterized protein YbjQ (UPF0145 family)